MLIKQQIKSILISEKNKAFISNNSWVLIAEKHSKEEAVMLAIKAVKADSHHRFSSILTLLASDDADPLAIRNFFSCGSLSSLRLE